MALSLEVTAEPSAEALSVVGGGLAAFNDADVGPAGKIALAVLVRSEAGEIEGGLSGYTAWGWLYIQWLWLAEPPRGQGLAARLLEAAEIEAKQRGCHGAYIDTFNPAALAVYQRQGYEIFGALQDFPRGRTRSFLQKRLV